MNSNFCKDPITQFGDGSFVWKKRPRDSDFISYRIELSTSKTTFISDEKSHQSRRVARNSLTISPRQIENRCTSHRRRRALERTDSEHDSSQDGSENESVRSESEKKKYDPFDSNIKQEPWKGLNENVKAPKKTMTKRLKVSIPNATNENRPQLPTFKNPSNYRIGSLEVSISNTCSINTFLIIFMALCVDSKKCRALMESATDEFTSIVTSAFDSKIAKNKFYKMRGEFLRKAFHEHCKTVDEPTKDKIKRDPRWPRQ